MNPGLATIQPPTEAQLQSKHRRLGRLVDMDAIFGEIVLKNPLHKLVLQHQNALWADVSTEYGVNRD